MTTKATKTAETTATANGEAGEPKIHSAIIGVMRDIGAVGKHGENKEQKYNFRAIDDVYNALHPALVKNGVFVTPTVIDRQCEAYVNDRNKRSFHVSLTVRFRFTATDGSFVEAVTVGEGLDYSDKAGNKAMSGAFKYACFQVFAIPTGEMLDSENDNIPIGAPVAGSPAGSRVKGDASFNPAEIERAPVAPALPKSGDPAIDANVEEISRLLGWLDINPALSVQKFLAIEAGNDARRAEFLRNVRTKFLKDTVTGSAWAVTPEETVTAFAKLGVTGIDQATDEQLVKLVDWVASTAFKF